MKLFFYTFLLFISVIVKAEIIPFINRIDWSSAGYQHSKLEPQKMVNVMDFGAQGNGISDDSQAIRNAILSFNGSYGIVYLPAGTYLLNKGFNLPDSVIIRGDGSELTHLEINSTNNCFSVNGSFTNIFTSVLSGFEKNSNTIRVKNSTLFAIGNYVEMRQTNGNWDTKPASWANKVVGQISKIVDISGDTLVLEDKLRISFEANLCPEIQKIIPKEQVSIENLSIQRTNNSMDATSNNFQFHYAVNCLISGVESNKSHGSHAKISSSSHIEITGSYFHHSLVYDGAGTKGYGIVLDTRSGLCLITNNIFRHLRHAMMTKDGANGNVFAYNYSTEVYRNGSNEFPSDFGGDISLHGHYSFANLFEGNIVQSLVIDEYWGPSGPNNTFFRNRMERYGIYMSTSATNNSNFVGNETIGSFPYGFYAIRGKGNFVFANNRNGLVSPANTTFLSDSSYFYTTIPSFWDIPDKWPSIGISNDLNAGTIPAKNRYNAGIYTIASNELTTDANKISSSQNNFDQINQLEVMPNPARDYVFVNIDSSGNMIAHLNFINLQGKVMKKGDFYILPKGKIRKTIDISNLSNGVYFMRLATDNGVFAQKLMVR